MKTIKLDNPPSCPKCGSLLEGCTHADDATPDPGDLTICFRCGELLEFTPNMQLKIATPEVIMQCDFLQLQAANRIKAGIVDYLKNKDDS